MANANNQNGNSGLRHRKSAKNTDEKGNYKVQHGNTPVLGNVHNPNQQMMGWMPPYPHPNYGMGWMQQPGMQPYPPPQPNHNYGMGGIGGMGWMPAPGMQPYPPQQPNHNYGMGGMGWMPAPGMQQPMQPHQVFNNRGFAPSHNGNIQDIVHINELEEEIEDININPIKPVATGIGAAAASYAESDDDVVLIPEPNAKNHAKKPKKQNQDNQLADLFDNALDNNMQGENLRKAHYTEFGQESDESNVIIGITHIDKQYPHPHPHPHPHSHFDNVRFPNEMYNATMVNGDVSKLPAKDISSDALETATCVQVFVVNPVFPFK